MRGAKLSVSSRGEGAIGCRVCTQRVTDLQTFRLANHGHHGNIQAILVEVSRRCRLRPSIVNQGDLESWLVASHRATRKALGLPDDWWPNARNGEQAYASAWALAFFLTATKERCFARKLRVACSASESTKPLNAKVLKELWKTDDMQEHQDEQVLVDYSVHNWASSNPVQLTGESEAFAQHRIDSELTADSYGWDFFKLLVVPSSSRLFFARVGGLGGVSAADRCEGLSKTLIELVDWYGAALLRPHDELGVVIIPSSKKERSAGRILFLERGRLRSAALSERSIEFMETKNS